MEITELFETRKKKARLAGIFYIVLAFAAIPDMLRKSLFVMDNAVSTGQNILANPALFRISILGDIATEIAFLFLGLCLYGVLKDVSKTIAQMMFAMVLMAVTMTILNTGPEIAALNFFEANDPEHGMLFLKMYSAFMTPTSLFYGLWMYPLGYLFWISGFMPKFLGLILMIGSSGYVIHAVIKIMAPHVAGLTQRAVLLAVAAEVATIIWLLVFGVKKIK